MRTAVCFSGELRSIDKCLPLIQTNILNNLPEYDLFYFTWKDDRHIKKLQLFENHPNIKSIVLEDRKIFDLNIFTNKKIRGEVDLMGMLRQLYCLKRVNEIKNDYSSLHGVKYDWVIRIRPDIFIVDNTSFTIDENMDGNKVYIPNHDNHHGYNDRFYVSSDQNMNVLCSRIDDLMEYAEIGGILHYEKFFKFVVDINGIDVERIDLRFNLLRPSGEMVLLCEN